MFEKLLGKLRGRPSKHRVVRIRAGESYHAPELSLVIASGGVFYLPNPRGESYRKLKPEAIDLIVGAPGLPNVRKDLELGEAVLYQLPDFGVVEIRIIGTGNPAKLLITEVSPRRGLAAHAAEGLENAPFASDESVRISNDLKKVADHMTARPDVTAEQIAFLRTKLDEIADASRRLGRKDWIMFTAGAVTNVIAGAAFAPEAAKALLAALNVQLSWVFQNALRLTGS